MRRGFLPLKIIPGEFLRKKWDGMGLLAGVAVAFAWLLAYISSAYYSRICNTSSQQFGLEKKCLL